MISCVWPIKGLSNHTKVRIIKGRNHIKTAKKCNEAASCWCGSAPVWGKNCVAALAVPAPTFLYTKQTFLNKQIHKDRGKFCSWLLLTEFGMKLNGKSKQLFRLLHVWWSTYVEHQVWSQNCRSRSRIKMRPQLPLHYNDADHCGSDCATLAK
jgi:hypothetical protein